MRKSNLKFCTVASTKDTHQLPKYQVSVAEPLSTKPAMVKQLESQNYLSNSFSYQLLIQGLYFLTFFYRSWCKTYVFLNLSVWSKSRADPINFHVRNKSLLNIYLREMRSIINLIDLTNSKIITWKVVGTQFRKIGLKEPLQTAPETSIHLLMKVKNWLISLFIISSYSSI